MAFSSQNGNNWAVPGHRPHARISLISLKSVVYFLESPPEVMLLKIITLVHKWWGVKEGQPLAMWGIESHSHKSAASISSNLHSLY